MALEILPLGDAALVVRGSNSLGKNLALAHKLKAARLHAVQDIVPAFASVGIFFESPCDLAAVTAEIRAVLKRRAAQKEKPLRPRKIEIPVCYDREFALDLERVARHARLAPNEVAKCHQSGRYHVRCLGFTPGFPYLDGLPRRLATPRRDTPRTSVPAGSVAIGGAQSGIYPLRSPGGWNIIGRTPLRLFDVAKERPTLLRPGDEIRFCAISRQEFEQWEV
ncbi:MAG TPA: 5-oxoprolinase subunit PxpB [Chthoniobacterales bacterium]|jgi:inhibitor of KinA